jgi:hypothetical protein
MPKDLFWLILGFTASSGVGTPGYNHIGFSSMLFIPTIINNNYHYCLEIIIPAAATSDTYGFQYALVEYEFPK